MKQNNSFIQINKVSKSNNGNAAIDAITCRLDLNKRIGIIGETGSGKSTLLKVIAGLCQPDEGEIYYNNHRILGPEEKLIPGHPKIAYLSQHFELRNNYQIWDILSFENQMTEADANELYNLCKINHLLNRWTDELSGGEKQRIALAKLLITQPELLLLDEPFSNLDNQNKAIIHDVINDLMNKFEISCIMVSHDTTDILSWCDELLVIQNGSVIQQDETKKVYHFPVNIYAAGLLGGFQLFPLNSFIYQQIKAQATITDKSLFIRPHFFTSCNKNTSSNIISGFVKSIDKKGFYCLIDISVETEILKIVTLDNEIQEGDMLHLKYNQNQHWFI